MSPPIAEHDVFVIEQLIRPMVNLYKVSAVGPAGTGEPVAFARQKRLALKEDLRIFADDSESEELFRIKARRAIDIGGRYDVTVPGGERIGVLERRFRASLIRTTWAILDGLDEREIAWARERSLAIALLRRVQETIPLPYHFTISIGERQVGEITRAFSIRDRYQLDLRNDTERVIDRRVAVALAIGLDALQAR
jgi:uncharacterized protein YxjI